MIRLDRCHAYEAGGHIQSVNFSVQLNFLFFHKDFSKEYPQTSVWLLQFCTQKKNLSIKSETCNKKRVNQTNPNSQLLNQLYLVINSVRKNKTKNSLTDTHRDIKYKTKTNTYKAIIINGEDVLLLGHQEAKAPTSRVLEGDAASLWTQNPVDIVPIVQLVVVPIWDPDGFGGVTILDNDEVVWLQEWPPHFQEIEVPDCGDHYVKLIFQRWWHWGDWVMSHGGLGIWTESEWALVVRD